ncbi:unnamed protein product [Owenia fusiformis]|uniref:Rhodanese domain-containing protein n=1 Tax=Owenia fusiformis TaxID=6347 RepID=A0A8S4P773_OWEFU|nr:unnamed protein product [Owenia fusiformis]
MSLIPAMHEHCFKFTRLFSHLRSFNRQNSIHTNQKGFPKRTKDPLQAGVTEVIDVRTPAEFKEDHIPGAINLPVLDDKQRVKVGTLYSKSPFEGRKIGGGLVTAKIGEHIENYFQHKPIDYTPLIYCWRAGQRSMSMAMVLSQIGFDVYQLEGGYKHYRQTVRENIETVAPLMNYKMISGLTGSGKTMILKKLGEHNQQVIDLEELAKHKGSILGIDADTTQPKQKYMESLLSLELSKFNSEKPVWLESESRNIGSITIPNALFSKMKTCKRYVLNTPMEERVKHLLTEYPYWIKYPDRLKHILTILEKYCGKRLVEYWRDLIDQRKGEEFLESILVNHYDTTYYSSQKKNCAQRVEVVNIDVPNLSEETIYNVIIPQLLE